MKKKLVSIFSCLAVLLMMTSLVVLAADGEKVVTVFVRSAETNDQNKLDLYEAFEKETGIKVELKVLPGNTNADMYKKIDVALLSGDQTDVIQLKNPLQQYKYSNSGLLMNLDKIAPDFKFEEIFGDSLKKYEDNAIYHIPSRQSMWAVFYNKKIFDEAGVDVPKGSWDWNEYIETALRLQENHPRNNNNNPRDDIYGSYMLNYDNYFYFLARQKEIPGYKDNGLSNYDHPAFKEALKLFGDLGNEYEIQPDWLEYNTRNYSWNQFMSGNFGMHFIGSWYMNLLSNEKDYPRDWEWGIVQVPTPEEGNNNFGVTSDYSINKNSKNPDLAWKFIEWVSRNEFIYTKRVPVREDIKEDKIVRVFNDIAKTSDIVNAEDIANALLNNNLGFVQEKIVGVASSEYSDIIKTEGELYLIGEQSLEKTVDNIKRKADIVIERSQN